jgi:hypothetical protein
VRARHLPKRARKFVRDDGALDMIAMHRALYVNLNLGAEPLVWRERQFQASVIEYIDKRYPAIGALCFHVPLELLRRDTHSAGMFHALGARAGVADIVMLKPAGGYHGLVLELKVKPNRPTISQCEFLKAAREQGYAACWSDSYNTILKLIDVYLSLPPRALMRELTPSPEEAIHAIHSSHQSADETHRRSARATHVAVNEGTTRDGATAARHR